MSSTVFPTLAGLKWDVKRIPMHKTVTKATVSGREFRALQMLYPRYTYKLAYEVLRDDTVNNELKTLMGLFNSMHGSYDSFLYSDPDDNAVVTQTFGTGDGVTTQYQLVRTYGGFVDPIYDVNGAVSIYNSAVLQGQPGACSVSATGLVTFVGAPAAAAPLTWTGSFYWRCRFLQDALEFNQFMKRLWDLRQLEFITEKP